MVMCITPTPTQKVLYAPGYAPYIYIVFGDDLCRYAPGYALGLGGSQISSHLKSSLNI